MKENEMTCYKIFSSDSAEILVRQMEKWNEMNPKKQYVQYTILSKPVSITFRCEKCDDYVLLPFNNEYWESGCTVECPVCGTKILLGELEYD